MAKSKKLFKVRDRVTGKFWNGDVRCTAFNETGHTWKNKSGVEGALSWLIRYRSQFGADLPEAIPDNWEIVEVELKEVETGVAEIATLMRYVKLKEAAEKVCNKAGYFMEVMKAKGVLDDIEFIFKLKPSEGLNYVDFERTKEARAHLRQLGVKTRTFRECNGVFGMMDRQQALKARLVLDADSVIDLGALRTKLFG